MSKYFDWPNSLKRFVRFDGARAEDVNNALDELSAGLDNLDGDVDRALKLPAGSPDQTLNLTSGQRANLLLRFDANGNISAIAGGGRWRGDFAAATLYAVGDYYRDPVTKNIYSTVNQHTSTDVAGDLAAGRVQLAINVEDVELAKADAEAAATTATTQAGISTTQAGIATTQAGIAATQASNASASASAALVSENAAAASYDAFDDRYLGAKASDPTVDNDGDPLIVGALYFSTSLSVMRIWNGSTWQDASSSVNGTALRFEYTATAGQTTFAATYDVGFVDVYLNGVRLASADFTATDGSTVVLATGAADGDSVYIIGFGSFVTGIPVPGQTGEAGKFLSTDGEFLQWQEVPPSTPFSSNTALAQVQATALCF
jgi:hypothetical protein